MRLHGYLSDLAADGASTDLVRVLVKNPSEGHTVRGLARLSGKAVATTARAVQRLEDRGLTVMPDGRSHVVRPNMKSYALKRVLGPAIRAEESAYDAMLGVLRRDLARKPCSITSAAVFGSTVRGEDHDRSDVDLLVVSTGIVLSKSFCNKMVEAVMKAMNLSLELIRGIDITPETFCKDFLTLLYEDAVEATIRPAHDIYTMFDLPLKPVIYDTDQFAEKRDKYFLASMLARYAMVYGKDLREL